jgi:hypothetical protein
MSPEGVRRSGRIAKKIAILLTGCDVEGRVFSEETSTIVLSLHGAGINSQLKLVAEQELFLRSTENNREAEIRIVGQLGSQGDLHTYGVAFVDKELRFWDIDFPPPTADEVLNNTLSLECSSCKSRVTLDDAEVESDVHDVHGSVLRYCDVCCFSTLWKRAEPGANGRPSAAPLVQKPKVQLSPYASHSITEDISQGVAVLDSMPPATVKVKAPAASVSASTSTAPSTSERPENRRKNVRAKVNVYACIRGGAFGDDIVQCEDMSRGGLKFRSKNCYAEDALIEVAVPVSPETPQTTAIFVPAKILHVVEWRERKLYRCGVIYLKSNKDI